MSTPDAFAELQAEYAATQPDMRRLERGITFGAISDAVADIFRYQRATALHASTFAEGQKREILLVHHRPQRRHPRAVRLLMNDSDLDIADVTKHAIIGKEFVAIPSRGLIRQRTCRMLEQPDNSYAVGYDGFKVERQPDTTLVNVRHGTGYRPDFPKDTPTVDSEGLAKRQALASELVLLLANFRVGDSLPVDYLFMPQLND